MTSLKQRRSSGSPSLRNFVFIGVMVFGTLALSACGGDDNEQAEPQIGPGTVVYGVRGDSELVKFNRNATGTVVSVGNIAVGNGEKVVGLDFRPADGMLHAVTSTSRSLIIDPDTALATAIQPITGTGTAFTGNRFGVDFNPQANALRIISDDGLNLRVPTAALAAPAPATPVNTLVDGRMGYLQGVTAAAYTFPLSAPGVPAAPTELFVIDTDNDALYKQDANVGRLTLVGPLGVNATAAPGYDIVQVGAANEHYAVLTVGGSTALYSLNAATGAATELADLPDATYAGLVGEAEDPVNAPNERFMFVLKEDEGDYSVEEYSYDAVTQTLTLDLSLPINGLPASTELVGLDVRTTSMEDGRDTGYAVSRAGVIYGIEDNAEDNPTALNAIDRGTLSTALAGTNFGVDFNPRADLLRIVSDTGQNLRVNLQAGRMIAGSDGIPVARAAGFAFVDGTVRLVSPAPQIVATAYRATNPGMGNFQYALDARDNSLLRVSVPNDGALVNVGPLGVSFAAGGEASFDISAASDATVVAALQPTGQSRSSLYSINLDTGAATLLGVIGTSGPVNAITARVEQ